MDQENSYKLLALATASWFQEARGLAERALAILAQNGLDGAEINLTQGKLIVGSGPSAPNFGSYMSDYVVCPTCRGKGSLRETREFLDPQYDGNTIETCTRCGGRGYTKKLPSDPQPISQLTFSLDYMWGNEAIPADKVVTEFVSCPNCSKDWISKRPERVYRAEGGEILPTEFGRCWHCNFTFKAPPGSVEP